MLGDEAGVAGIHGRLRRLDSGRRIQRSENVAGGAQRLYGELQGIVEFREAHG